MGQVLSIMVVMLLIIFTFVPMSALNTSRIEVRELKQNLNLSAKALACAAEWNSADYDDLAEGYDREPNIRVNINRDRLLGEFNEVLKRNYYDDTLYGEVKSRILLRILVEYDKFFAAGSDDRWSPPYFFTFNDEASGKGPVYLGIGSDEAYYYDAGNNRVSEPVSHFIYRGKPLDREVRNDIIIDAINRVVSQYTRRGGEKDSLFIEIKNPEKADEGGYTEKHKYFNVLQGVTLFVIYAEDERVFVSNNDYHYRKYSVTGYTLK